MLKVALNTINPNIFVIHPTIFELCIKLFFFIIFFIGYYKRNTLTLSYHNNAAYITAISIKRLPENMLVRFLIFINFYCKSLYDSLWIVWKEHIWIKSSHTFVIYFSSVSKSSFVPESSLFISITTFVKEETCPGVPNFFVFTH